jgi:hypothetical protein
LPDESFHVFLDGKISFWPGEQASRTDPRQKYGCYLASYSESGIKMPLTASKSASRNLVKVSGR